MENRETLEDFIGEAIQSDDYYELLSNRLDSMPRTRAAADELLSSIISYDEPALYVALLQEYKSVLTGQEITNLKRQYSDNFEGDLSIYGIE